MTAFAQLAQTIITNAPSYKSTTACAAMAAKLKRAYSRAGSYGCQLHQYKDALFAIQCRYLDCRDLERSAA